MFQTIEVSGRSEMEWNLGTAALRPAEERVLHAGDAAALTDAELLAVLLGIRVDSAGRLLEVHGSQLLRLFSEGAWAVTELSPARQAVIS